MKSWPILNRLRAQAEHEEVERQILLLETALSALNRAAAGRSRWLILARYLARETSCQSVETLARLSVTLSQHHRIDTLLRAIEERLQHSETLSLLDERPPERPAGTERSISHWRGV